ncbi:hypothetical protein MRX96_016630 [Rhipicephalus microplus]
MVRQRTETTHPHGTTRNTPVIQRGKKKKGGRWEGGVAATERLVAPTLFHGHRRKTRSWRQESTVAAKESKGATEGETRSETKSRLRLLLPTHGPRRIAMVRDADALARSRKSPRGGPKEAARRRRAGGAQRKKKTATSAAAARQRWQGGNALRQTPVVQSGLLDGQARRRADNDPRRAHGGQRPRAARCWTEREGHAP